MYNKFEIEIKFREKLHGGLPKNEDALKAYVKKEFKSEDTTPTDTDLELTEEKEISVTGFRCDDVGIYVGGYQVKAMLAQSASLLGLTTAKRGAKNTLKEGLIIEGRNAVGENTGTKCYLLPIKTEPDGTEGHTGNVPTPQGNRSIVKAIEYVEQPSLKFALFILENRMGADGTATKNLTVKDIKSILAHGRTVGLGSHRKYESGHFDVVSFNQVEVTENDTVGIDF